MKERMDQSVAFGEEELEIEWTHQRVGFGKEMELEIERTNQSFI